MRIDMTSNLHSTALERMGQRIEGTRDNSFGDVLKAATATKSEPQDSPDRTATISPFGRVRVNMVSGSTESSAGLLNKRLLDPLDSYVKMYGETGLALKDRNSLISEVIGRSEGREA
jgi:hypothetical protein